MHAIYTGALGPYKVVVEDGTLVTCMSIDSVSSAE